MGYFSNGSEGSDYQAQYCSKCQNFRDEGDGRGEGCPIYDLHLLYNDEQDKQFALDHFIPRNKEGFNEKCVMFLRKP